MTGRDFGLAGVPGRCSLLVPPLLPAACGVLWVFSCRHSSLASGRSGLQRRTHLDEIKLGKWKELKSRPSGWWRTRRPLQGFVLSLSSFLSVYFSVCSHLPFAFNFLFFFALWIPLHPPFFVHQSFPSFLFYFSFPSPHLPFFHPCVCPVTLTFTFSRRGLLCSAACAVIMCSYTRTGVCVCGPAPDQLSALRGERMKKEKKITPQWVISGWANLISLGTLIMERTWIMNGCIIRLPQARWMN